MLPPEQGRTETDLWSLLALLVIGEGGGSMTDNLVDGVWPSERPRTARQSLAKVVSGLRRDFGNDLIETTPVGYRLGSSVGSDRNDFLAEVRVAERCLRHDPEQSDEVVRSALKRWRGEPWMGLDGWQLDQDRYALLATRDRAVRTQAMALVALERHAEAAEILLHIIDSTSADEDLWAALATDRVPCRCRSATDRGGVREVQRTERSACGS